jgi:hypothetical protein
MMARVACLMGAQIAIVSADMSGTGGNNTIDFMQTIKACEHMGLRTGHSPGDRKKSLLAQTLPWSIMS